MTGPAVFADQTATDPSHHTHAGVSATAKSNTHKTRVARRGWLCDRIAGCKCTGTVKTMHLVRERAGGGAGGRMQGMCEGGTRVGELVGHGEGGGPLAQHTPHSHRGCTVFALFARASLIQGVRACHCHQPQLCATTHVPDSADRLATAARPLTVPHWLPASHRVNMALSHGVSPGLARNGDFRHLHNVYSASRGSGPPVPPSLAGPSSP